MLTLDKITTFIKQQQLPFLRLYMKTGYQNVVPVGMYNCENCSNDDSLETKCEKAVEWLHATLSIYEPTDFNVFNIKCRQTKSMNDTSERFPGEFTIMARSDMAGQGNVVGQQLSGLPSDPTQLGYVSKTMVDELLGIERERSKIQMRQVLLEDKEKAIAERERILNTDNSQAANRLYKAGMMLFDKLAGASTQSLSGPGEPEPEKIDDPKEREIENLAQFLYDNLETVDDVSIISKVTKNLVNKRLNRNVELETESDEESAE